MAPSLNEAIILPTSKLICCMPAASTPGPISMKSLFT